MYFTLLHFHKWSEEYQVELCSIGIFNGYISGLFMIDKTLIWPERKKNRYVYDIDIFWYRGIRLYIGRLFKYMNIFGISHYNFIDLGIITIGRFYNVFDSKYVWEVNIHFLFWELTIQINN